MRDQGWKAVAMRGKRKQGRGQEEKEEAIRDGEDGRRKRKANGRDRKERKQLRHVKSCFLKAKR